MDPTRPGRRRGTAWIVGLAVLVLLAGVGAVLWGVLNQGGSAETADAADVPDQADAPRGPGQMTIDVSPTSGYVATLRVIDAGRQALTVENLAGNSDGTPAYAGQISAFEPAAFDPAVLRAGQPTVVAGRDGWYVPQYIFPGDGRSQRTAVLGWQDVSGLWLLVYADTAANDDRVLDPEHLQRLAETVLVSPPHDLRAPFRVGFVPAGLTMTYLAATDNAGRAGAATVGLSAPDRKPSAAAAYGGVPGNVEVSVSAAAPDKTWQQERDRLTGAVTIAGRNGWLTGPELVIETDTCVVRVHSDPQLPRTELDKLVKQLLIGDCTQTDGWTVPA
jgi:hypothetical protein